MPRGEVRRGAGGPYTVRPVMFKGLQYAVKDREGTTVHLTRSHAGAVRRRDQLAKNAG